MRKQTLHPQTAAINQKQKNHSKKARLEALTWLTKTFPKAFDTSLSIQPLSLGIMKDILLHADKAAEAGISKSKLREAVVIFTRRIDYLACLKAREMRIDLTGLPTEAVSEEDAENAAAKIKKRVEKSAKIARKNISALPRPGSSVVTSSSSESNLPFPEREPAFSVKNSYNTPARVAAVTIKHKPSRQYDPEAVARLKAKLGLSRKDQMDNA